MLFRIRLLPILVIVGALMLGLKSYDFGKSFRTEVRIAIAETELDNSQIAQTVSRDAEGSLSQAKPQQDPTAEPQIITSKFLADQDEMSREEVVVLEALKERRLELERREQEARRREAVLRATERRIDEKVGDLQALEKSISALVRQHDNQMDVQLSGLVKIYENMKPKDAAQIFATLDMPVALMVIERMKERRVAPILASMDPNRAREITVELASRLELPVPKE